jgi:hypothetical protein
MHDMCNWEIDLKTFTSQDTYKSTKIPLKDTKWHMWFNTTNKWTVQLLYGINRHIYSMITCVSIIYTEPCIC